MVLEKAIVLPLSVITIIDLSRVQRELGNLDEFLLQSAIRTPGTPMNLPRLSKLLDDLATVNKLNLLEEEHALVLCCKHSNDTLHKIANLVPRFFFKEKSCVDVS